MNTKSTIKRILCFGDSLTFGHDPVTDTRFPANKRWTGVLQDLLGLDYEIIEEGMGGRTTNLDDPKEPVRNGFSYFKACIQSHVPLDIVIILLGTNDLKNKFHRSAQEISEAFREYDSALKIACDDWGFSHPKVLLLSPPHVDESNSPKEWGFDGAEKKSKQFAKEYKRIAEELGYEFFDLSPIAIPSKIDGVHLEESENKKIGQALSKLIKTL